MLHKGGATNTGSGRLRIGIWCDYGCTLTPNDRIGAFIHNLVRGLLALEDPLEVFMLVRRGDQGLTEHLVRESRGRLHIAPPPTPRDHYLSLHENFTKRKDRFVTATNRLRLRAVAKLTRWTGTLVARARNGSWLAGIVFALGMAAGLVGFLFFWIEFAGYRLAAAAIRGGFYPLYLLGRGFGQWMEARTPSPLAAAAECSCDVWVIPFTRIAYRLDFPSVLVTHDLVDIHFSDSQEPEARLIREREVRDRCEEATLCACLSNSIRDHDLKGVLRLPPEKIRVIRSAPPNDFSTHSGSRIPMVVQEPDVNLLFTQPYIFFPGIFRPHNNHRVLVESLHCLSARHGEADLHLVFTGIHSVPESLDRLIRAYGLTNRVQILGNVDWSTLGRIYQGAIATIVPSLYKQESLPIYEALQLKCPVACSDIPSLREQCKKMGDAMLYFDPNDSEAVARVILQIRQNREAIIERQFAAGRLLWQRTWQEVARDWLAICKEAVEIARNSVTPSESEKTKSNQAA